MNNIDYIVNYARSLTHANPMPLLLPVTIAISSFISIYVPFINASPKSFRRKSVSDLLWFGYHWQLDLELFSGTDSNDITEYDLNEHSIEFSGNFWRYFIEVSSFYANRTSEIEFYAIKNPIFSLKDQNLIFQAWPI